MCNEDTEAVGRERSLEYFARRDSRAFVFYFLFFISLLSAGADPMMDLILYIILINS
jgi:hypothetical protein